MYDTVNPRRPKSSKMLTAKRVTDLQTDIVTYRVATKIFQIDIER